MKKQALRGQSLIESTLVLAAFLGLMLAVVDVGQMLFTRQTLAERAHDAARWGAMHRYDPQAIRNFVLFGSPQSGRGVPAFLGLASDSVQVSNPGCPGPDCRISVAIAGRGVHTVEPVE